MATPPGVDIDIQHVFGARCEFRDSVLFSDNNCIVYPAGAYLARHRLDSNSQSFLYLQSNQSTITALSVFRGGAAAPTRTRTLRDGSIGGGGAIRKQQQQKAGATPKSATDARPAAKQQQQQNGKPTSISLRRRSSRAASRSARTAALDRLAPSQGPVRLVAYSELNEVAAPSIFIYDLNTSTKKRVLAYAETESDHWKHLEFSHDGIYLLAVSGPPDYTVVAWNWSKSRLLGVLRPNCHLSKASFYPRDSTHILAIGPGVCRHYQWIEGHAKLVSQCGKIEQQQLISHAWADATARRMFLGTAGGKLLVWEDGEFLADLRAPAHEVGDLQAAGNKQQRQSGQAATLLREHSPRAITCIRAMRQCVVCSCGPGVLLLFERTDDKELYHLVREFRILLKDLQLDVPLTDDQEILGLCVSPDEEYIVCTTDRNLVYHVHLAATDFSQGDYTELEPLLYSTHTGAIYGLDVCQRRPLFATCGTDRSVRVWNYATRHLEMMKKFPEEAYALSFHPGGLQMLVGFSDRLRLMLLMHNDIKSAHEFPIRGCRECAFSHGGHMFGAVNGNVVQLYSSITYESVSNLKGHASKIRHVLWSHSDTRVVSTAVDGHLCVWDALSGQLLSEVLDKSAPFHSAALSPDDALLYLVAGEGNLREYTTGGGELVRDFDFHQAMNALLLPSSGRYLLLGSEDGKLAVVRYPIALNTDGTIKDGHVREITRLVASADEAFVISASTDGSVIIWRALDSGRPLVGAANRRVSETSFADETLVDRQELDAKNAHMRELERQVERLVETSQAKIRQKSAQYEGRLQSVEGQYAEQLVELCNVQHGLVEEREALVGAHALTMRDKSEYYERQLADLNRTCEQKLALETEKYRELETRTTRREDEYTEKMAELNATCDTSKRKITEHYDALLVELSEKVRQAHEDEEHSVQEHEDALVLMELFCDQEMLEKKGKYERGLVELKDANLHLKLDGERLRKEFLSLQEVIEQHKREREQQSKQLQREQQSTRNHERDIRGLRKEIDERDEGLQEKERRIQELSKKNQELEKFRYVLEFKQAEMEKEMAPVADALGKKTTQIDAMEEELKSYRHEIDRRMKRLGEIRNRIRANEQEVSDTKRRERRTRRLLERFQSDFQHSMQQDDSAASLKQNGELKARLQSMFQRYVVHEERERRRIADSSLSRADEFARQRDHLQSSVDALAKHHRRERGVMETKLGKLMREHEYLLREANELRNDLDALKDKARRMDLTDRGLQHKDRYQLRAEWRQLDERRQELEQRLAEADALSDWHRGKIREQHQREMEGALGSGDDVGQQLVVDELKKSAEKERSGAGSDGQEAKNKTGVPPTDETLRKEVVEAMVVGSGGGDLS